MAVRVWEGNPKSRAHKHHCDLHDIALTCNGLDVPPKVWERYGSLMDSLRISIMSQALLQDSLKQTIYRLALSAPDSAPQALSLRAPGPAVE